MTPASLRKIGECRRKLDALGQHRIPIQVDGNVSFDHIPAMVAAGAASLVAGTSRLFHSDGSWPDNMQRARAAIATGLSWRPTSSTGGASPA
jgi:ribulose-phosphate 3-epimerase